LMTWMAEIVRRLIASPLISGADRISAVGLRGHYAGGGRKIRDALAHTAGYDRNAGRLLGTTADGAEASGTHGHVSFGSASHESTGVSFDRRNGQQSTAGDEAVAEGHDKAHAATVDLRVEHVAPVGDDTMTMSGGTDRPAAEQDIRPNAQTALAHSAKNRESAVPSRPGCRNCHAYRINGWRSTTTRRTASLGRERENTATAAAESRRQPSPRRDEVAWWTPRNAWAVLPEAEHSASLPTSHPSRRPPVKLATGAPGTGDARWPHRTPSDAVAGI
jgi:hypothetical protein